MVSDESIIIFYFISYKPTGTIIPYFESVSFTYEISGKRIIDK